MGGPPPKAFAGCNLLLLVAHALASCTGPSNLAEMWGMWMERYGAGPHMVHCHTVHLPLGALLIPALHHVAQVLRADADQRGVPEGAGRRLHLSGHAVE